MQGAQLKGRLANVLDKREKKKNKSSSAPGRPRARMENVSLEPLRI